VHPKSTNLSKVGRAHLFRDKNADLWAAPCACCAQCVYTLLQKYIFLAKKIPFVVLFLTIWRFVRDNSIQDWCSEPPCRQGTVSLHLIAMALWYWGTSALELEVHSGLNYLSNTERKGLRVLRVMAPPQPRNSMHRPGKVRNSIDWQSIPW
jgi:hypothetical protein